MATQKPLGDLPMIILTIASRRKDGLIHPLPAAAGKDKLAIGRAIASLCERELVVEVPVENGRQCWRKSKTSMTGHKVTEAGQDIAAKDVAGSDEPITTNAIKVPSEAGTAKGPIAEADEQPKVELRSTKIDAVIALLQREGGATLDELVAATGWLTHTTRAALTGLRKKGHTLQSEKVDGARRYRITASRNQTGGAR